MIYVLPIQLFCFALLLAMFLIPLTILLNGIFYGHIKFIKGKPPEHNETHEGL